MMIKMIMLGLAAMLLTNCASTTIYPNGGDVFTSVSTSSSQAYAEKDAQSKAAAHCKKLGKQFVVMRHETQYHGADTATKIAGGVASGFTGGTNLAVSENDYEVILQFKCVNHL